MPFAASLIRDGDLDVANNYQAARNGSGDAGEPFRGVTIGHHTKWVDEQNHRLWNYGDIYALSWPEYLSIAPGAPLPRKPETLALKPETMHEYMLGQAAFPLVLLIARWFPTDLAG